MLNWLRCRLGFHRWTFEEVNDGARLDNENRNVNYFGTCSACRTTNIFFSKK